jgi:putative protease
MRVVVGLPGDATSNTVTELVEAGADELFAGYVPPAWWRRWGVEVSPNRRFRARSQFLAPEPLAAAVGAARALDRPVFLTLNEHFLVPTLLPLADEAVASAVEAGVSGLILGAPELGPRYAARHPGLRLVASGEAPVYNRSALEQVANLGFERVILPREVALDELPALVAHGARLGLDFEAFLLGEWCVYNGALCFTCHGYGQDGDFCSSHTVRAVLDVRSRTAGLDRPGGAGGSRGGAPEAAVDGRLASLRDACALCSLGRMRQAGVTHVKVPGRASEALHAVRLVRGLLQGDDLTPEAVRRAVGDPVFCDGSHCRSPLGVAGRTETRAAGRTRSGRR